MGLSCMVLTCVWWDVITEQTSTLYPVYWLTSEKLSLAYIAPCTCSQKWVRSGENLLDQQCWLSIPVCVWAVGGAGSVRLPAVPMSLIWLSTFVSLQYTCYWGLKSERFFLRCSVRIAPNKKVRGFLKMFCMYVLLWIKSEGFLKDVLYIYIYYSE